MRVLFLLLIAPATGFLGSRTGFGTRHNRRAQLLYAAKNLNADYTYTGLYDDDGRPHGGRIQKGKVYRTVEGEAVKNPYAYANAVQSNGGMPRYLFHYTSRANAEQIMKSGYLKPSVQSVTGDAMEGDGCYFTSIPPWAEPDDILANNYDGAARRRYADRAESYVCICVDELPWSRELKPSAGSRDVWVVFGTRPLDLVYADAFVFPNRNKRWWKRPGPKWRWSRTWGPVE